jgi:lysophospholipase L1-like esterase
MPTIMNITNDTGNNANPSRRTGRYGLPALIASTAMISIARAETVLPNDPRISFSDYAHVEVTASHARFDRIITNSAWGLGWDNPGARIRFRTDAASLSAQLTSTAMHTLQTHNGTGLILVDGQTPGTFNAPASGALAVPLSSPSSGFHDYEIVLPYGESVEFNGLTINGSAGFATPTPRPATRWVAYGDSITQGFHASALSATYPWLIGKAKDWEVVNMGFGSRQANAGDGIAVRSLSGDVITVLIGVNNALGETPITSFSTAYEGFLDNIRAEQPDVPIFAITPLWVNVTGWPKAVTLELYRQAIRNIVTAANDPNLHLVEGPDLIPGEAQYFQDGLHPNTAGFALMAANLEQTIAVPEPGTGLLAGAGSTLAALRRRRLTQA